MLNKKFIPVIAKISAILMLNTVFPFGFASVLDSDGGQTSSNLPKPKELKFPRSGPLTESQQKKISGRAGQCPYLAGQNKWDIVYKGVNMMTGNYSMSATDLDFEGGYGIPVNVTRSYSANSIDDGPLGYGWTLSADVRNTAGGILKSSSAPVRSVPENIRERPPQEVDPNAVSAAGVAAQPAQAVVETDSGGHQETVQRDVDGVLTTPPWDNNVNNTQYQFVTFQGSVYQIVLSNVTITPDGTTYVYSSQGNYPNGVVPYNNSSAAPYPANVLKVTSATDRQGNVTNYLYGSTYVNFYKSDGMTQEHPLVEVNMPNGHKLDFTWSGNHVSSVTDNCGRTVYYTYSGNLLVGVKDPAGLSTYYGYGAASNSGAFPDTAGNLLTSITDPRGLTTSIFYTMTAVTVIPYMVQVEAPYVNLIQYANGSSTVFQNYGTNLFDNSGTNIFNAIDSYGNGTQPFGPGNQYYSARSVSEQITNNQLEVQMCVPRANGSETINNVAPLEVPTDTQYYDVPSESKIEDIASSYPWRLSSQSSPRYSDPYLRSNYFAVVDETDSVSQVNFAGNPLKQTVTEETISNAGTNITSTKETDYAYWDQSKYWQQKAVFQVDSSLTNPGTGMHGRFSYTDYYSSGAGAGSRGQTFQVYDNLHGNFILNTTITPPSWASAPDYWKYQLQPSGSYSAQFAYDSSGRCTDVYKLQNSNSNPWSYVHTVTQYGQNTDGSWGEASQVTEDSGGIGRTTKTLGYTSDGKADIVQDAAGHIFNTAYDADGKILSVTRTDGGLDESLVNYVYGGSGITNGQPISITDGLSGITQSLGYISSGPGLGQVGTVTEGDPSGTYTDTYQYDASGARTEATYSTPNGSTSWGYYDYISVGAFPKVSNVFQRMAKLDSQGNPTSEEYDYQYDTSGKLLQSTFAQTPQAGFTPSTGQTYYDGTHPASSRVRAMYIYDGAGRTTDLTYYQEVWNGSSFTPTTTYENSAAYDPSLGLKTSSTNTWAGGNTWTETYGYDPNFDYLTSVNYGDGNPNAIQSWTYDAAGNRTDSVCDNLNRPVTIGAVACTSDILGNRLTTGSTSMNWDCLNRMTGLSNASGTWNYLYRADGMRVSKTNGTNSTIYRYDGQMSMEDVDAGSNPAVTDYAIGARGIDAISKTVGSNTVVVYPIYDAHGNMVADISRSGSGSFAVNDKRSFDAWGNVRSGATSGDPKGRYCANLGHVQDDESGLVYMRARYYEPASGRFISEDPTGAGTNWNTYCGNSPVDSIDSSGYDSLSDLMTGAADESYQTMLEAQQGEATLSWAQNAIEQALQAWADQVAGPLFDALFNDGDLAVESKAVGRIQITGLDGQYGIGIESDGTNLTVKTYEWGSKHIMENIIVPIADWW